MKACPKPKWLLDAAKLSNEELLTMVNILEFRISVFRELLRRRRKGHPRPRCRLLIR